jgi:antitoxin component YwqK of YwqJK toxin-antitoxin module
MKTMPFLILLIALPFTSFKLNGQSDTLNQEINGMKQGYWIIYGRDIPEKEYPSEGRIEEGKYLDNRKNGFWIKYHPDGETPRLKGNYKNGRPNGEYIKIFPNGKVREKGNYHNKIMSGAYETRTSEGIVTQRKTFNERGKEEGKVEFYYDDGTPQMILTKKDGVTVGDAITYYPNGDVKKIVKYSETGEIISNEEVPRVNPPKGEEAAGAGGPKGDRGIKKDGKPFNRDGYNKLYNENDEIWMDGEFKNSKLWNGELFKYDSDGILLKIEIWKLGKYHSDGHL